MRAVGWLVVLLMLTAPSLVACGSEDPVVIATSGDYHPFNFISESGEIDGLERELGDELCRRAGLECRWMLSDWETMIPDLMAEEFDLILAGMSITARRGELIDFTQAYSPPTPSVFVVRAGREETVPYGTIGVTANTIYSDYMTESGRLFVPLDGSVDAVDAVLNGQVDAALVDHSYGVAKREEREGLLAIVETSLSLDQGLGIGVRQGSELRGEFDQALASMKSDGSLNELLLKWLGEDAKTFR